MNNATIQLPQARKEYCDYLRVFATFAVIVLHVSAQNWYTADVNGFAWQVFNVFDSIVRWCVPAFVMISGSLFLNKQVALRTLYSKYILRMASAFFVWSSFYAIQMNAPLLDKVLAVAQGHYHMWFILMIIGIYICLPLIKPLVETDCRTKYTLAISFVFAFILPEVFVLVGDFGNEYMIRFASAINAANDDMNVNIVLGYTGYFILGYFLDRTELKKRQRIGIYVLGLLGAIFTILADAIVAVKTQTYCSNYYSYFSVNVLLETIAVFTLFKYAKFNNTKLNQLIKPLAKYSFGAYIVHAFLIEQLDYQYGFNTFSLTPIAAVLSISIIVFLLAFLISALLNHIPVLKEYIV